MKNRVNIYGFPHKGLRNALGQLSLKAGAVNISNEHELEELKILGNEVSELLNLHLKAEEEFVLPPLESKVPGSTDGNHQDHLEMERLEDEMVNKLNALVKTPDIPAANDLYNQVNLFIREYYRHMNDEEDQMNKIIWEHFNDPEILEWQGKILAKLTPEQFFKWFKFIIPALLPEEQIIMLSGFKQNAPSQVYESTIHKLKPYLTENQLIHIQSI